MDSSFRCFRLFGVWLALLQAKKFMNCCQMKCEKVQIVESRGRFNLLITRSTPQFLGVKVVKNGMGIFETTKILDKFIYLTNSFFFITLWIIYYLYFSYKTMHFLISNTKYVSLNFQMPYYPISLYFSVLRPRKI